MLACARDWEKLDMNVAYEYLRCGEEHMKAARKLRVGEETVRAMRVVVDAAMSGLKIGGVSTNEAVDGVYKLFPAIVEEGGERNDVLDELIGEALEKYGMGGNFN
jgi:hypothetical protein